uniref:Uncharacterized protein n=1 Tax=Acrobeloides nanus TaxID=290746 RepID=A0A914CGB9_9BILA
MTELRPAIIRFLSKEKKLGAITTGQEAEDQELLARQIANAKSMVEYSEIGAIERILRKNWSIDALKKSLVKAWNTIPQEVIDRAVDDFSKRLKKCIEVGGSHFENK